MCVHVCVVGRTYSNNLGIQYIGNAREHSEDLSCRQQILIRDQELFNNNIRYYA